MPDIPSSFGALHESEHIGDSSMGARPVPAYECMWLIYAKHPCKRNRITKTLGSIAPPTCMSPEMCLPLADPERIEKKRTENALLQLLKYELRIERVGIACSTERYVANKHHRQSHRRSTAHGNSGGAFFRRTSEVPSCLDR